MGELSSPIKVAFGSVPKDGGTYTFYRNIRQGLLGSGIDLKCVSVGKQEALLWESEFADDGCVLLANASRNRKRQAQAFAEWCEQEQIDIVMGVNSVAIQSALPYLPKKIKFIARCANAFAQGYRITMIGAERLSRIVALAPIQVETLIQQYGAERSRIVLIPNGTDPDRFEEASTQLRGVTPHLRLGFLGRLEHRQKGVLFLPDLLSELSRSGMNFELSIAGKGVHEGRLREQLQPYLKSGSARFLGALKPDMIASFLGDIDVLVFPSNFEGSPNVLIEAMMAGCVSAAWDIEGLVDFLVEDGVTGVLAEPGNIKQMAAQIENLHKQRKKLQTISANASTVAKVRFSKQRVVEDYSKLFHGVMSESALPFQPLHWRHFAIDGAFHVPVHKRWTPEFIKTAVKNSRLHQLLR